MSTGEREMTRLVLRTYPDSNEIRKGGSGGGGGGGGGEGGGHGTLYSFKLHFLTAINLVDIIQKHKPNLMFIHFDSIDDAGHGSFWGSQKYYDTVKVQVIQYF